MRITLVHNPAAGPAQTGDADAAIARLLRRAGHAVTYVATGSDAWRAALQDPGDLVAIAGGDGTVAEVLRALPGRDVPTTIFPTGTANNIAATLGIGGTPAAIIASWPDYRLRPFDLGLISVPGVEGEQHFVEALGLGVLTEMIGALDGPAERLNEAIGRNEGPRGYVGLLRSMLAAAEATRLHLRLDGEELEVPCLMLEALNIGQVGPSLRLGADALPGDGLLDLLLVTEAERERLDAFLEAQQHGGPATSLPTRRVRHLEIEGAGHRIRLDDRVTRVPDGTLSVRVSPGALRVLAPAQAPRPPGD